MPLPLIAIIIAIISIAAQILMALLAPKPKGPKAEKVDLPTVTEGRTVPVSFGTDLQAGPNLAWFGDVDSRKKKQKAGSSSVTVGYYYFCGLVWYLCHGPNNRLRSIRMEDKIVWSGTLEDEDEVFIDKSKIFGDQGGGIVWDLKFYAGNGTNSADPYLVAQNPGYPDHRHFCYIVSRGPSTWSPGSIWKGYIGLSPGLRPVGFEVERIPTIIPGLSSTDGQIEDPNAAGIYDANPVVFLYEMLTNEIWGIGMDPADPHEGIDEEAFRTAAIAVRDEELGLSFISQDSQVAGDLIEELLRHIDAAFYHDRQTGKWTIRLIRDDYDPNSLPILNRAMGIEVTNYGADGVGQLRDTVRVKFLDRAREYKESFATVRNPAVRAAQGYSAPHEVEYPFCRRADLANQFAAREALIVNNALKRVTITGNRKVAHLNPGDVFRFQWPEYGADVVMRVAKIGFGAPGSGEVSIEAVEDKFALASSLYTPPTSSWTPTDYTALNATNRRVEEMPYFYSRDEFPRLGAVCAAPNSLHIGYDLDTQEGADDFVESDQNRVFAPYSTLVNDISGFEAADDTGSWIVADNSSIAALATITSDQQRAGRNLALVDDELISFSGVTSVTGGYQLNDVRHGVLDTVPAGHTAGTGIYFPTSGDTSFVVPGIFAAGGLVTARFRPFTPSDGINDPNGNTAALTFDSRAARPLPPANITVNGTYRGATAVGYITLEWSERNRLTQTDVRYQDDADVAAESGTTYVVRVYNESDTLIRTEPPTTDTEYTYTETMMVADTGGVLEYVRFEIESVRDSLVSWQPQSIRVEYIEP